MLEMAGGHAMAKAKLTAADREFLSKGERRKQADQKRRQAVNRTERVGPTPETLAKLVPCPISEMHRMKLIDNATRSAARELAELYVAVYGCQMPGARGAGGHHQLSDEVAWKHKHRFLPWDRKWSHVRFQRVAPTVIDVVVFGRALDLPQVAKALADYAKIRRENPLPPKGKLAMEVA